MWLLNVLLFACVLALAYSFAVVNRYFSFKLHKNTFPLTLTILTCNLVILLFTAYLLPLDVFYATRAAAPADLSSPQNSTASGPTSSLGINVAAVLELDAAAEQRIFRVAWLLVYWLEFVTCWFVIPVLISYCTLKYACAKEASGTQQRSPIWERLIRAIFQNLKFYLLCLLGLVCGVVYLLTSTGHSLSDFKPLIISLSHLYSLSYTLILLSIGLIIFPKNLYAVGRLPTSDSINRYFVELSKTNDDLNDSRMNMLESADRILSIPEPNNGDVVFAQMLNDCKLEVRGTLNETDVSISNLIPGSSSLTVTSLDKLNKYYNEFITHYYNFLHYQTHSNSIIHILAQSQSSNSLSSASSAFRYVKGVAILLLAAISVTLSLLIVYLEMTPTKWGHGWIFDGNRWYNFALELIIFAYNTFVSLYAMSRFKFSNFHLIPNGRSNPTNALYYSLYSSRLLFPLCFNFMVLVPSQTKNRVKSSFETTLYDNLTVIPLVGYLNKYLPSLFLAVTILSYKFDLKQKVLLKVLGEEYYYQFFGMMMYEPVGEIDSLQGNDPRRPSVLTEDSFNFGGRSQMDEDYEYSLQDGRYLFERASSNYDMSTNNGAANSDRASGNGSYL
ncbi:hypothetical protein HG536_0A09210 [Torulaspora globosa]|uniref:LMBR1 domain-containing protein n=1 Tax=Torulaspora globosa TaxID=48254 RepID=A0A7G3ZC68_9SACH|nr:uncharacterized protein HG536_0A09210 [Torulaspora globosa]QLL31104.1 hypothetical protein HG536_0A09210 [Torulaspora globosa]